MRRTRLNPYGISKSARLLANYLEIKRLKIDGSKFVGKNTDVVINWGNGKGNVGNAKQINKLSNVQLASNKLHTLEALQARGVSIPCFSTDRTAFDSEDTLYGRSTLYGHSGRGIHIGNRNEVPHCPLYTLAIDKIAEYRVIVVGGKCVDFKKKKKKSGLGDYGEHIWNHSSGYIFARNGFTIPDGCRELGVSACIALGLDFGAVDIIEDGEGKLYVLEVNTAFGIEGTTLQLVGDALKELIDDM